MVSSPPPERDRSETRAQVEAFFTALSGGEVIFASEPFHYAYVDWISEMPGVRETIGPPFRAIEVQGATFVLVDGGYFMLVPDVEDGGAEVHMSFRPEKQGSHALERAAAALEALKARGVVKKLIARFPYGRHDVARFVRRLGFEFRIVSSSTQVWRKVV